MANLYPVDSRHLNNRYLENDETKFKRVREASIPEDQIEVRSLRGCIDEQNLRMGVDSSFLYDYFPEEMKLKIIKSLNIKDRLKIARTSRVNYELVQKSFINESVDLSFKKITDDSLKIFSFATEINVSSCPKITDEGLAHLKNATTVGLRDCS